MMHASKFSVILIASMLILDCIATGTEPREENIPPGGYRPIDVNDPRVTEFAAFATTALSSSQNAGQMKLIKIVKAETQVVAGTNTKMTLELSALPTSNSKTLVCEVVVFDQSWTNTRKVTQSSCNDNVSSAHSSGVSFKTQNVNLFTFSLFYTCIFMLHKLL